MFIDNFELFVFQLNQDKRRTRKSVPMVYCEYDCCLPVYTEDETDTVLLKRIVFITESTQYIPINIIEYVRFHRSKAKSGGKSRQKALKITTKLECTHRIMESFRLHFAETQQTATAAAVAATTKISFYRRKNK